MLGITLAPEQIRTAPPEMRHWLEHLPPRLAACMPEPPEAALLPTVAGGPQP